MKRNGPLRFKGFLACSTIAMVVAAGPGPAAARRPKPGRAVNPRLRRYESPYYVIHTDHGVEVVREAYLRLTVMAEEYHRRTKGFGGVIRRRMPFYLFSNKEDYIDAGGEEGSSGMFTGDRLMAVVKKAPEARAWHVVQHEGFHQFAHYVIRGSIPIWVNEGMAEYFAHGIWTGDNLVTGLIPPGRMKQVQSHIKDRRLLPMRDMLKMTMEKWTKALESEEDASRNYDQAWSTVHFLVHADDGKYHKAFVAWINDLSRNRPWDKAFSARFGSNVKAFEKKYADWWLGLPEYATSDRYIRTIVETLTSFLARAYALDKKFNTAEEFFAAAREGKLAVDPMKHARYWLPPSLLDRALRHAEALKVWSLDTKKTPHELILKWWNGTVFTGTFVLQPNGRPKVTVAERRTKAATAPAK